LKAKLERTTQKQNMKAKLESDWHQPTISPRSFPLSTNGAAAFTSGEGPHTHCPPHYPLLQLLG
jgi:hypothetical protein